MITEHKPNTTLKPIYCKASYLNVVLEPLNAPLCLIQVYKERVLTRSSKLKCLDTSFGL
jgi:hypothetical protein